MVQKLRRKFILVGMSAFTVMVALLVLAINLTVYIRNDVQSGYMLDFLSENNGEFPTRLPTESDFAHQYRDFSEEMPYETRFFTVTVDENGDIENFNISAVAAIEGGDIASYTQRALSAGKAEGRVGSYRFRMSDNGSMTFIVFLDQSRQQNMENDLLSNSLIISGVSLLIVLILLYLFSSKAIAPTVNAMEKTVDAANKQMQFITDAGHELKTPLAIISANNEVLERMTGSGEWTQTIRHQVERLDSMVAQMLTLARLHEARPNEAMSIVSISDAVRSEAEPFSVVAQNRGCSLTLHIESGISGIGIEERIRKLVSVLLENAVKYSDDGGEIVLKLERKQREWTLDVSEPCEGITQRQLQNVFDRFYRADVSRSRKTGGSGIGLSIAKAITDAAGGSIEAHAAENRTVSFVVTMPLESDLKRCGQAGVETS